jgi:hypothetical protein
MHNECQRYSAGSVGHWQTFRCLLSSKSMWNFIKALPIAVGLPLVIGAASIGPEDAASNISKWALWFGVPDIPAWLTYEAIDTRAVIGAFTLSAVYATAVWGFPRLRKGSWIEGVMPKFMVRTIDDVPIATLQFKTGWVELRRKTSTGEVTGQMFVRVYNSNNFPIRFTANLSGEINATPSDPLEIIFDGIIYAGQENVLISNAVFNFPVSNEFMPNIPSVVGVLYYRVEYRSFSERGIVRVSAKKLEYDFWPPLVHNHEGKQEHNITIKFLEETES